MIVVSACCAIFSVGLYGVLTRRDLIGVLASVEVMLAAALLLLVALAAATTAGVVGSADPQAVAVLLLAIAAAEAAVGLALLVAISREESISLAEELVEHSAAGEVTR